MTGEANTEEAHAEEAHAEEAHAEEAHAAETCAEEAQPRPMSRRQTSVAVVAVFVAGLCSIVYELLIGTTSSYFLGDSITQFSITIGLFMAAMGLGSFLSRKLDDRVLERFVLVELCLGVVGGLSVPALYFIFAYTDLYEPAMMVLIVLVGALTGLEIPMLVLVMRGRFTLKDNLSNILALDYFGALGATLLFPFVLLPTLGTFRSGLVVGLVNVGVALLVARSFPDAVSPARRRQLTGISLTGAAVLCALFVTSPHLLRPWHGAVYEDRVIYTEQTPYQKIVVTRGKDDLRLFLNGNLQFSAIDEYRYHEALVHPAMATARRATGGARNVLVLGGGDGLGIRELLKYPDIEAIALVDLDPAVTRLAKEMDLLRTLNGDALSDPRVTVHHEDAFMFLEREEQAWDVIIADLPDPNNASLARLYSREFYRLMKRRLARAGVMVTQATSPFFAKKAYWCIDSTIRSAELSTLPYHAYVPSFGDWGFVMAARYPLEPSRMQVTVPTRYLDDAVLGRMFVFEKDLRDDTASPGVQSSTLDEPKVLSYYLAGWKHWN